MTRALSGEDRLLDWLRGRADGRRGALLGHDAAILPAPQRWAVTVDQQVEGVHFPAGLDPAWIARRLLAVNLSDLAATGALPAYAFLALAAPAGFDHRRFFSSFLAACREYGVRLAGGDLTRDERVHADLTLLGRRPPRGRWLRRSGARPGHRLWIGGTLGEAAAGLALLERGAGVAAGRIFLPRKFSRPTSLALAARRAVRRQLQPTPQLKLGLWLGKQEEGAAIDVSDGLARDLHRLCRESDVGAEIEAERLPCSRGLMLVTEALDVSSLDLALGGGEDYVLLFTLPPRVEPPAQFRCTAIGIILAGKVVRLRHADRSTPLPPLGWDHLQRKKSKGKRSSRRARRS